MRLIGLLALILVSSPLRAADVDWSEVPALKKVHYWRPMTLPGYQPWPDETKQFVRELVRITGTGNLSVEWCATENAALLAGLCRDGKATIGLFASPWHQKWDKQLPPYDTGAKHQAELAYYQTKFRRIKQAIGNAPVSLVALDTEVLHVKAGDSVEARRWNDGITQKHNAMYRLAKSFWPAADVNWYGYAGVEPAASETGWSILGGTHGYFTLKELNDGWACPALYWPSEIGTSREIMRRTVAHAERNGLTKVMPYVTLGEGFHRRPVDWAVWDEQLDYDLVYSWMIGAELNSPWYSRFPQRFMPASNVKAVYLWRGGGLGWMQDSTKRKHLLAYIYGANSKKQLRPK